MRNESDIFCLRDSERGEDDGTLLYSVNGACAVKNFRRRRFRYANEPEDIMVPRQPAPQQVAPPDDPQVGSKSPRKSASQSPRLKQSAEGSQVDPQSSHSGHPMQDNHEQPYVETNQNTYMDNGPNAYNVNQVPFNAQNQNPYSPGGEAYYAGYQNVHENQNPYLANPNINPNLNGNNNSQPMYAGYQGSPQLNSIPEGPPGQEYGNYIEQNPPQQNSNQEYQHDNQPNYPANNDEDDRRSDISHVSKASQRSRLSHHSQILRQDTPERTPSNQTALKSQSTQSVYQPQPNTRSSNSSVKKKLFEPGDSHSPSQTVSRKSLDQAKMETEKIIQQTNKLREETEKINKSIKKIGSNSLADKESTSSIARNPLTGDGMEIEPNKQQKKYFKTKDQKWQW